MRGVGDLIHLNRFRKRKQQQEAKRLADANARRHGRTKADRLKEADERRRFEELLTGALLRPTDPTDPH